MSSIARRLRKKGHIFMSKDYRSSEISAQSNPIADANYLSESDQELACWRFMESVEESEIDPDEWAAMVNPPKKNWRTR